MASTGELRDSFTESASNWRGVVMEQLSSSDPDYRVYSAAVGILAGQALTGSGGTTFDSLRALLDKVERLPRDDAKRLSFETAWPLLKQTEPNSELRQKAIDVVLETNSSMPSDCALRALNDASKVMPHPRDDEQNSFLTVLQSVERHVELLSQAEPMEALKLLAEIALQFEGQRQFGEEGRKIKLRLTQQAFTLIEFLGEDHPKATLECANKFFRFVRGADRKTLQERVARLEQKPETQVPLVTDGDFMTFVNNLS